MPPGRARSAGSLAAAPATERVLEHVIRHATALGDRLRLVERPVDAEVDATLTILLLGLGERREPARNERAHGSLVVPSHAVELVGYEFERDVVGLVKIAQRLEEGAPEAGVPGRVGRERRGGVWGGGRAAAVAERCAERRPGWVSDCQGGAIDIRLAGAGDRPPELVRVLRLPERAARVRHR